MRYGKTVTIAVCPGSFDPITFGHVDVVRRASHLFSEVIVAVAINHRKNYTFTLDERVELADAALADDAELRAAHAAGKIRVVAMDGLLAEFCRREGATAIIKGLRGSADFDDELAMALMNRHLSDIETVFLLGDPNLGHVGSSLVKDVARHGGTIDDLVPAPVARALAERCPGPRKDPL